MLFYNFFIADPAWINGDSSKQTALQEYFTAAFKEVEPTERFRFLSIYKVICITCIEDIKNPVI